MKGLVILAILGAVFAAPSLAAVVVPQFGEQVGQAVGVHHHFVFDKSFPVRAGAQAYDVYLADGDLYELPVTTSLVLRGSVHPAPSDADIQHAVQYALDKYDVPVLKYDIERSGEAMVVHAALPAGMFAELSPQYQRLLAQYES
ncbi:MAG: hypothetical protein LC624_04165 [Halobacteriales archaeon]|nr:hypothetical protein [Halobacteriales archaeon]